MAAQVSTAPVILAGYRQVADRDEPPADAQAKEKPETDDETPDDSADARTPTRTYTVPGERYRQMAWAIAAASLTVIDAPQAGRELSESVVASASGTVGRLGLTAPPTRLAGRVTSRPGLQDGPATGLGFTSRDRSIFTAQFNPLSGAGGRCQELARSGFYGGSRAGCESSFSARRR